jgi:hypothetical protein
MYAINWDFVLELRRFNIKQLSENGAYEYEYNPQVQHRHEAY